MNRFLFCLLFAAISIAACRNGDPDEPYESEAGYEEDEHAEPAVTNRDKPEPKTANYLDTARCDAIADTVTYTQHVKAVMETRCAINACHDASTKANGIELTDYARTRSAFEHGKGLCSILHDNEANCRHMPTVRVKLPDRHIAQILCWAKTGYAE